MLIIIIIIITKPKDSSPDSQKHVYCAQFNTIQTNFTAERGVAEMYVQCNIEAPSDVRILDIAQDSENVNTRSVCNGNECWSL